VQMIRKRLSYIIIIFIYLSPIKGQEVLTGLQSNPLVSHEHYNSFLKKDISLADTVDLPFFDDFSGNSVLPDKRYWLDDYVYINNTYSRKQVTLGIATFDALDNTGSMYADASTTGFKADQLTSKPVNLDYPSSDNIWLSFVYEPGGLSDPPEQRDSLTLQFYAPDEAKWYSVWRVAGSSDTVFKSAIIPVNEDRFLKKGFQFRFTNYASISSSLTDPSMIGNCDIWNIDYVRLDRNRNATDTAFADVAFTLPLRSLLKTHEAMPWKHFLQIYLQEMGSFITVHYRNNDAITRNVTRNFEIRDMYSASQPYFFTAGATNIESSTSVDYDANLIYTYSNNNPDSALFRVTASLKTDIFDPKENDTLVYYQVFSNYFAFDDGTSEGGYGINGQGSRNAMVACRFRSFIQDTLRAINICFNDSYMESNKRAFDLMVWDDDNGLPGNVIYTKENMLVQQGKTINGYYTYTLTEPVMVDGTFYVGWRQRSETFLNAGFDINTPNKGRQYYWINGNWNQSQLNGSLMIRPVVGDPLVISGIEDTYYKGRNAVRIWPNPAGDYINLDAGDQLLTGIAEISIIDLSGRQIIKVPFTDRLDISSLQNGYYIVVISVKGKPVSFNRIIKTK
jgi:hypothetical protein